VTQQRNDGFATAKAVGAEVQYARQNASVVGYVDYDTAYKSLNALVLLGTLQLPDRWQVTVDLEHRNAPIITTQNALIGQPEAVIEPACCRSSVSSRSRIWPATVPRSCQRTAPPRSSSSASVFQTIFDVFYTKLSATPASGGVEAFTGTGGNEISYQMQLLGSSILRTNDFNQFIVRLRYDATYNVIGWQYIFAIPVIRGHGVSDPYAVPAQGDQYRILPRSFTRPYGHLTISATAMCWRSKVVPEVGKNPAGLQIGNTTRLFVSIGYRINF